MQLAIQIKRPEFWQNAEFPSNSLKHQMVTTLYKLQFWVEFSVELNSSIIRQLGLGRYVGLTWYTGALLELGHVTSYMSCNSWVPSEFSRSSMCFLCNLYGQSRFSEFLHFANFLPVPWNTKLYNLKRHSHSRESQRVSGNRNNGSFRVRGKPSTVKYAHSLSRQTWSVGPQFHHGSCVMMHDTSLCGSVHRFRLYG